MSCLQLNETPAGHDIYLCFSIRNGVLLTVKRKGEKKVEIERQECGQLLKITLEASFQ